MLTDDLRARLERLNRQTLPMPVVASSPSSAPLASGDMPTTDLDQWSARTVRYFEAGQEVENAAGRHLAIVLPLSRYGEEFAGQIGRVCRAWSDSIASSMLVHPDIAAFGSAFPSEVLFLDLETCGLGGAMIFLIGLMHATDEGVVVEQLLARNYAEERSILARLWQIARGKRMLVTFNGKSFDWPLVHDRSTLHRLGRRELKPVESVPTGELLEPHDPRPELPHLDVLHHARRRWRHRLPNCRLQTLERYLCRRVRRDDVPGHAIPQAYHDFVRTGSPQLMESILHHNALDLVTMTQVAMRMLYESSASKPIEEHWSTSDPWMLARNAG